VGGGTIVVTVLTVVVAAVATTTEAGDWTAVGVAATAGAMGEKSATCVTSEPMHASRAFPARRA
jgi:hypothetical protein